MKPLTLATAIVILSAPVYAETVTEGTIRDFDKSISRQVPMTSEVCEWQQKTSTGAGALFGGVLGALAGEALGGDSGARNAAGAFGALVGGSQAASSGQVKVCKNVTTYRTEYENVYSHSIITFFDGGARYQLRFVR